MNKNIIFAILVSFVSLLLVWGVALYGVPADKIQGEVYRILYLHVPSALACFFCGFVLFVYSVKTLIFRNEKDLLSQLAAAEVGFVFTILTLATGSIWGKPTWNTWWTWDARLTTTFILALLYAGYMIFYHSTEDFLVRLKACSVLGILVMVNIPIIYYSVNWWRTLHQPQTLIRSGGSAMDPAMLRVLLVSLFVTVCCAIVMMILRRSSLVLAQKIEQKQLEQNS